MRRALIAALGAALGTALAATGVAMAAPAKAPPAQVAEPTIRQPGWKAPKTAWGDPGFSGYWSNAPLTPLVRNPKVSSAPTLSLGEGRALEGAVAKALEEADAPSDPNRTTQSYQANAAEA